jgi:predicted ribosome-associated RNA-binding protein Tma20
MAATLRASAEGLEIVDKARCKKGWVKTEKVWADLAATSQATLRRFWTGIAIQAEAFKGICAVAGVEDWESIIDVKENPILISKKDSRRLSFAIAGSIEEIDKRKLEAIVALLNKLGGDTSIEIVDVDEGSIKLILNGSSEALERIESLAISGELTEVFDISVQDIHFLKKAELVQLINKNGAEAVRLDGVNLSNANLSRSDLSNANLIGADLIEADLIEADLSGADLIKADLSRANLREANLRGADLRFSNLSGANLRDANVMRAKFGRGAGISAEEKQDLIKRGAIFGEGIIDRAESLSPSPRG